MTTTALADVSAYDRLRQDDERLCALLASGSLRRELLALFGADDYQLLGALARRAAQAAPRHAAPVYLLPGIMGTQLGRARASPLPADLLWIDAQDIIHGGLAGLRLPEQAPLHTLGAQPYSYLALRLRLQAAGFRVVVHDYDWRLGIDGLAHDFAARLRSDPARGLQVVAHSMGGLIARLALALPGLEHVQRLVTLGTPHRGAYGAVQALRGTYPVVRRLAALDQRHDAESLAAEVFGTFPSLYQLLPARHGGAGPDLHDPGCWPRQGPRPDARLLAAARDFAGTLPPPDARCITIAGTGQRTVTGVQCIADDFRYEVSDAGDGTVALQAAQLAGCDRYFVRCEHSALPRSATVARALLGLLRNGRTRVLATVATTRPPRPCFVTDRELRGTWATKVDWGALAPAARRAYLNQLNMPPPQYAAPAARDARRTRP